MSPSHHVTLSCRYRLQPLHERPHISQTARPLRVAEIARALPGLYSAAIGVTITGDDLLLVAERVNNVERTHNARLGLTSKDDTMPPKWTEEPLPSGRQKGAIYDILDPMREAWYKVHGWNEESGRPRRERLEELGLKDIADDLEQRGIPVS